jgi:demethylmenaquinone methyltransferase/2-methoxy-6-polyprenyl-1,4-benzoquinol methylase
MYSEFRLDRARRRVGMMDEAKRASHVRRMFDGIAGRYDLLNHLLSLNLDRRWRRKAVGALTGGDYPRILDLCGGTGDLSIELVRRVAPEQVICCDFSHQMLLTAGRKFTHDKLDQRCHLLMADALKLPVADNSFDAVTVAFGVRNFEDMQIGLQEILRVLKPGGRLVVLEFSTVTAPILSSMYRFYLNRILPRVGNRISGRTGPYSYLASTIGRFPQPARFADIIRASGFAACDWQTATGGIVAIHTATK